MANDVKLQSPEGKHPLDENLRPIKIGTATSPLELSKTDVKVNNLIVGGTTNGVSVSDPTKLPLAGGTMTGDITTDSNIISTDLTIDDSGDITLDAGGGDIYFKDDTTTFATFSKGGSTLLTIASVGGLTLDSGTYVSLDAYNGEFKAKKSGTEFSVAGSAFAGMILGYTTVGIDATADSYTLSATMTVIDDAMKVKFKAPPSGAVEIFAQIYFDTNRRLPVLGLSDQDTGDTYQAISFPNATDVTNEHLQAAPPLVLGDSMLRPHWVVTGLEVGTPYEWWFAAKTSAATGGVLRWGGTATNEYPPFIMKATALPTAVADYAVYG